MASQTCHTWLCCPETGNWSTWTMKNIFQQLKMFDNAYLQLLEKLKESSAVDSNSGQNDLGIVSIIFNCLHHHEFNQCWYVLNIVAWKKVFFLANPLRMNWNQCHDKIRANVDQIWEPGGDQASTLPSCSLPKAWGRRGEAESPNRPHGPQSLDAHPPKWHGEHCKRLWCCF